MPVSKEALVLRAVPGACGEGEAWGCWELMRAQVHVPVEGGSGGMRLPCWLSYQVKNLPAGEETRVQSLGREDALEEEMDYPLQYSWASLVAQLAKNLPAKQETWVSSLGREDPLEEGMQPTLVFWPGESHGQRSLAGYIGSMGSQSWTRLK